ncbi:MAG: hypothetical protein ACK5KU_06960 [Beutenbergiaceae bacterium]
MTTSAGDDSRTLLINGTVAAALAVISMILVHELAHVVAGLAMGVGGTLYSYGVAPAGNPADPAGGIIAIAAPIFSLVSGLVMTQWQPLRRRAGFGHLVWLLFAFTSMMEGIGYLVIAPFGAGDTAAAVGYFGWPDWVPWVMFVVGVLLQFTLAWMYAPHVGQIAGPDRGRLLAFALWAWLIATGLIVLLQIITVSWARMDLTDGEATAIIAASTALLVFSPMALIFGRRVNAAPYKPLGLPPVPVPGILALAAMIIAQQVLNLGVPVGV